VRAKRDVRLPCSCLYLVGSRSRSRYAGLVQRFAVNTSLPGVPQDYRRICSRLTGKVFPCRRTRLSVASSTLEFHATRTSRVTVLQIVLVVFEFLSFLVKVFHGTWILLRVSHVIHVQDAVTNTCSFWKFFLKDDFEEYHRLVFFGRNERRHPSVICRASSRRRLEKVFHRFQECLE